MLARVDPDAEGDEDDNLVEHLMYLTYMMIANLG